MRILSFGGGRQTVTIAAMACLGDLPMPDAAIYSDPGWEPATRDYLHTFVPWMEAKGMRFIWLKTGNIRVDILDSKNRAATMPLFTKDPGGTVGMLKRSCTADYKVRAVTKAIRDELGLKKGGRVKATIERWIGFSLDEVHRCKESELPWGINIFPLVEKRMDLRACLHYLDSKGIKRPPRSACIGCPYRSEAEWRAMKQEQPSEWEDACKFDEQVRRARPELKRPVYLHRSCVPLREANLDEDQGDFWVGDCEGYCGK